MAKTRIPKPRLERTAGAKTSESDELEQRYRQEAKRILDGWLRQPTWYEDPDFNLATMDYDDCLTWATGADGKFSKHRLEDIAVARGYRASWVNMKLKGR